MLGLFWWMLAGGLIGAAVMSIVVSVYLTRNNAAQCLRQNEIRADRWFVKQILSAERVQIGLKKGNEVQTCDVSCPRGHSLKIGDSGSL